MTEPSIKPHCPDCGKPYLGAACQCRRTGKWRVLRCPCGRAAIEVTEDVLGELPLCAKHLKKVSSSWAGRLAPLVRKAISSLASPTPPLPRQAMRPPEAKPQHPFGLTEREMQVARLSHLPRRKIAEELGLSEMTVKVHLRQVMLKMRVKARSEIAEALKVGAKHPEG